MSVTLNEAALQALLDTPEGPVGQEVQRKAEATREAIQERVGVILWNAPPSSQPTCEMRQEGASVILGFTDEGSMARYLVEKKAHETPPRGWVRVSLERVFP